MEYIEREREGKIIILYWEDLINAENLFFSKLELHKRELELEGLDL